MEDFLFVFIWMMLYDSLPNNLNNHNFEFFAFSSGLSEEVCDLILTEKLEALEERFEKKFDWFKTSPIEVRNVMLNMAYQLGFRGFCKFKKTIAYLEEAEWEKASVEMLDSKWAKQTPNRAKELSEIIKSL